MKKRDLLFIAVILATVVTATSVNLRISFRKSRDAQRIGDINTIANALSAYLNDNEGFPPSEDGYIVACGNPLAPTKCEWGMPFHEKYLTNLPRDPQVQMGKRYWYVSNGKHFQLYAALESRVEAEFNEQIESRNFTCGLAFCNFGKADGKTPLDKTLEEYENELIELSKKKK